MGNLLSNIFSALFGPKEIRILVLGLDNAGKTTILFFNVLHRLQLNEPISTVPTIGFNVETIQYKNLTFQIWDLGGQTSIRPYWRCYYPNTQAIVFVVDSADINRLNIVKAELTAILNEEELKSAVLLIFANKQDVQGAKTAPELTEALNLSNIRDRKWTIVAGSAKNGTGVTEGFDWLANELSNLN